VPVKDRAPRTSRHASGDLVLRFRRVAQPPRVWGPLDAFLYNVMTTNIVVLFGVLLLAGASFYFPVGSLVVAVLIVGGFCLAEALVYAFLVSSMPRNGGDYVFQSRLVSKWLSAPLTLTGVVVGGAVWMAIAGWFASRVAIGPFLVMAGRALDTTILVTAGGRVMSPWGVVALGVAATLWSALLNTLGLRVYARLQRLLVAAGLSALVVLAVYFALTRANVNQSAYSGLLSHAYDIGFRRSGHESGLAATIRLLPIAAFGLIYPGWTAFQAGELRQASSLRSQSLTIVGAKVVSILFALGLLTLPVYHVGEELLGAAAYLAIHDPTAFWVLVPRLLGVPEAPWLAWVTAASAAVVINTWFWIWVPNHALAASRVLLAMSWDRMLPRSLGNLDTRQEAPTRAILAFSVISLIVVMLFPYLGIWNLVIDATLLSLVMFGGTCVAAASAPFFRRELYRESTAGRFEVLRIPLVTVAGMTFAAFAVFLSWTYMRMEPLLEAGEPRSSPYALGMVFTASLAACLGFRWYRRRHEGADVEIYYRDARDSALGSR
jgi:amino acid transporter